VEAHGQELGLGVRSQVSVEIGEVAEVAVFEEEEEHKRCIAVGQEAAVDLLFHLRNTALLENREKRYRQNWVDVGLLVNRRLKLQALVG
jgi:hypothetical protein